jgi:dephospho-CoA kinase
MSRPYCVVLTGGIGSGKSLVADAFAGLGAGVVDTDRIARELTAPSGAAMAQIRETFGTQYLLADGGLDRRLMRDKVFEEPEARLRLEGILHPLIRTRALQLINDSHASYVVLVVPLLVETGAYQDLADRILVVDCDPDQQVERVMQRDGATESMARAILSAQAKRESRLALADDVIVNTGDISGTIAEVQFLHRKYLQFAGNRR